MAHCLQGQSSAASVIMTGFAFVKNSLIRKNNQPLFTGPKGNVTEDFFFQPVKSFRAKA